MPWREAIIEAGLLGAFMVSACVSVSVMEHPGSPVRRAVANGHARRAIVGLLMGLTAIALIYSPLGQRSGAHMNPATTLAFWSLGKLELPHAGLYIAAQIAGAVAGVGLARLLLGRVVSHPAVGYVATQPPQRPGAARVAFAAEFAISFGMFGMVLLTANTPATAGYTGLFAGLLVFLYITFEAPLSGMSMNPARTLGSALVGRRFRALPVYLTAPPLAMLTAALAFALAFGGEHVLCAKLAHPREGSSCCFRCRFQHAQAPHDTPGIQPARPEESAR